MRIGKISSFAGYRVDEHFHNGQFSERNLGPPNWKKKLKTF